MTNDFDLSNARRELIAMRVKHGADTPIGLPVPTSHLEKEQMKRKPR